MEASTTTRTHLSALADLSRWAIEVNDLDALLKLAIAQIVETLDAEYGLVLGLNEARDEFTVRAWVGASDPPIDGARCGLEPAFSPRGSEPLIVSDFSADDAVATPSLLAPYSIASGVSLALEGEGSPFGVLAVYSRRQQHFDAEDVTFLRSGVNLLASAIKRHAGERRLWQTRERSRLVMELLRNAIIIIDDNNRVLSVNPAATELFGYTADEFAELNSRALLHPEDPDQVGERFESGLRPDAPVSFTGRRLRKDGSTIHVSVNASRITWGGTPATLLEYSHITELAEATARLRASEEHLRHVFDTVQAALIITDNDARVVLANQAAAEMLGYTAEELVGRWAADFVHPDERGVLRERARISTLTNPSTPRFRRRMVRKDGESIWVEASPTLLEIDGEIRGRVTEYRDVSAQIEAEAAVRERDERLEALISAAPITVLHVNGDRMITFWGGAVLASTGGEVGITIDERFADAPERLARMERALAGESFTEQIDLGDQMLQATYQSLRDERGEPDGFIVVITDVTEQAKLQRQLREQDEQFRAVVEAAPLILYRVDRNRRIVVSAGGAPVQIHRPRSGEGLTIDERWKGDPERLALFERALDGEHFTEIIGYGGLDLLANFIPLRDTSGEPDGFICIAVDITERLEAERALQDREAKLTQAQRMAALGWWEWYPDTDEIVWSDEVYALFGRERGSVDAREVFEAGIHPDDRAEQSAAARRALELGEPYSIDHRIVLPDGAIRYIHEYAEVVDVPGKRLFLRGTMQDITDRVEAERAVRERDQQFRALVDAAPMMLFRVGADRRFVFSVGSAMERAGLTINAVVGMTVDERYADEPERLARMERALAGEQFTEEDEFNGLNWVAHFMPIRNEAGELDGFLAAVYDVTERVKAERAVAESEAKYRSLFDNAEVGMFRLRLSDGVTLEMNDRLAQMRGYSNAAEVLAGPDANVSNFLPAELRADFFRKLTEDGRVDDYEFETTRLDGSAVTLRTFMRADPEHDVAEGVVVDVTERAVAERALRESEARLSTVTETVDVGMVMVELDERVSYVNSRFAELTGDPAEELIGRPLSFERWLSPEDGEMIGNRMRARLRGDLVDDHYSVQLHRADGSSIEVAISANPVVNDGEVVGSLAMVRDVSQEAAAQASLRESEERLQEAQRIAELGSWSLDLKTYEGWWSDQEFRLFGLEPQSVTPTFKLFMSQVHPDDRDFVQRAMDDALASGSEIDLTHRIIRQDGAERIVHQQGHILFDEAGEPLRATGTIIDVTERTAVERALQQSEARYRSVVETISSGVLLIRDGRVASVNPALMDILGYEERELLGMALSDLVVPEDRPAVEERYRAVIDDPAPPNPYGCRMIRSDGRIIEVESVTARFAVVGEPVAVLAEIRDVTEEVAAQQSLRESEERNRAIVDSIAVPLTVWNPHDELLHHNLAVCELTGYSSAELSTMRPQELLDGDAAELILSDAADARAGVAPPTRICDVIRADGERRTVLLSMAAIEFPGEPSALLVQMVDISREFDMERRLTAEIVERAEERRQFVQQLLRAQEEERRQIAYEIHDGPAQQLTGAAMFFETFRDERTVRESDVAERRLELGVKYLNDALVETRRIMSRLRPALLDDLGLVPALRSSLSEMTSNAGIGFEFEITGEETRLDGSAEIVLFRVAQEAVANAVKHSGGTRVWLDLGFFSDRMELTVRDDGQGFNPAAAPHVREEGRHLGLVGMRERTELLDGAFDIDSGPGRGTRLSVTIPRPAGESTDGPERSDG